MTAIDSNWTWKNLRRLATGAMLLAAAMAAAGGTAEAANKAEVKRMVVRQALLSRTVPPSLALAVAKVESNFQDDARSSKDARGVMQIMPKTAREEFGVAADELWDPRVNIRIGIAYLERLHEQYGGRWDLVLSHYNGGSLNKKGGDFGPHSYTRKYVADILNWQRRYARDATAIAVAEAMDRRDAFAGQATAYSPAYWMFDDPYISKDWRHYLRVADYWLRPPEQRLRPVTGPYEEWRTREAGEYEPLGDGAVQPSRKLSRSIAETRARFSRHLRAEDWSWAPVGGLPVGDYSDDASRWPGTG